MAEEQPKKSENSKTQPAPLITLPMGERKRGNMPKLAYCDGPPYYYKVAYQEVERMLEQLA